ncbi:Arabinanase/levansucrase/invertase [Lophium mytilinum]|uniref:beta-fructofuranosidase n=1 Tax=Lophium mytilinum TaxID=390894 RepID=A0A6A6REJ2_9PEZI|nr:Arabinanase/levansucrase/invertase [Lophium mytilinum]
MPAFDSPPSEAASYSRPSASQAAADAIPVLIDDTYHIFHLSTPPNTVHHPPRLRSSWSRLRSKDLVSWMRDPLPVLSPSSSESAPDADGAWTGSAVLGPDGTLHIFYTGYNLSQGGKQAILHARSSDQHGTSFNADSEPIRIISPPLNLAAFEDIDFRDAYVFFNEEAGQYWMLVATRLSSGPHWTRGCIALLTSADLEEWSVEPAPLYAPNDMMCPECPELFTLPNGKWYLVYSRFSAPNPGTVYRIADSPRGPFRTPRDGSGGRFDARRWYAAKSCQKAGDSSKRIFFGWIADFNEKDSRWLWGGSLAAPRQVSARVDGSLEISPVEEVLHNKFSLLEGNENNRVAEELNLRSIGQTLATYLPILQKSVQSYVLEFSVSHHDALSFGVLLRTDDDLRGHRIRFEPAADGSYAVSLLTDLPPLDDFWADQYELYLPKNVDGPELARHSSVRLEETIRLVVENDTMELFVGGKSISYRIPPRLNSSETKELGFFVEDGTFQPKQIRLYYKKHGRLGN